MTATTLRKPLPDSCAEARALNLVGGKWKLLIVKALLDGPVRYVELQRCDTLRGISTEQLRTTLNAMVADKLLTRTRYRESPPRVDYELTARGLELEAVLEALAAWEQDA